MLRHVLALIVGLTIFWFFERHHIPSGPYLYDEADYMYAASLGVVANATDTPSMPLTAFFKTGLSRGRDSSQRGSLSELIRASDDVLFYRHWHGPLYAYWLIATSHWKDSEATMRRLTLFWEGLAFLVIYFGCLWLLPGEPGRIAAILASSLYLFSDSNLRAATDLAPHNTIVLFALISLFFAAKMLSTGKVWYWYVALVATGLAFCSLELAFVLVAALVICFIWSGRPLFRIWDRRNQLRFLAMSSLALVTPVMVVWPGAAFKFSIFKTYAFMTYLALYRKSPWGDRALGDVWYGRFGDSPVEWLAIVASVVFFLTVLRNSEVAKKALLPLLLYGGLMMLTLVRVTSDVPRYLSPFLPALDVFAGMAIALVLLRTPRMARVVLVVAVSLALFGTAAWKLNARPKETISRGTAILEVLREQRVTNESLLVPQTDLPMIHYYFPKTRLRGYGDEGEMRSALASDGFAGVIYSTFPIRFERMGAR